MYNIKKKKTKNLIANKVSNQIKVLFKKGFFHILTGNTLTKLIAFISSIVTVRLINKQNYAYLTYSNNLYSYITLFSGLGMSTALLKYCSRTSKKEENKAYLKFSLKYGSIFQIILSITLITYVFIADIPFPNARKLILLFFLVPTIQYVLETMQSYIRSQQNNKLYAKIGVVQSLSVLIFTVIFVVFFGVYGVPIARYGALIIVILLALLYIKKSLKDVNIASLSERQIKGFLSMGLSMMIANFFSMIMPMNEQFLVNNILIDEIITANYKVAMMIPSQLGFITNSIMVYYFPIIASMRDNTKILKKSKNIQIITGVIIGFISIIGYIFTPFIIKLIYGNEYLDVVHLSRIFWIVYAMNAGFRMIPMNILPALGRVKFNATMSVTFSFIHLILDYFLISTVGISGAAYATLIIYVISGIIYWIFLRRICKDDKKSANKV